MRALRGKFSSNSNPTVIYDLYKWISVSVQRQMLDSSALRTKIRIRYLSSIYGDLKKESLGNSDMSGYSDCKIGGGSDNDGDKFSGGVGADLSDPPNPIPGRPLRGERQKPEFKYEKSFRASRRDESESFSSRQRFHEPLGSGGGARTRQGSSSFEGRRKGWDSSEDGTDKKGNPRPSIKELFNRPSKDPNGDGQEHADFLDKFKISSAAKKDIQAGGAQASPLEEEKEQPPQDADLIFKKMKETGLIPNAVAMLDGLCKDGLVQEAMKLFGLMREKGTMPEVVIYTAVVEGFCQAHKFDDAKRIFMKMQTSGITPNAFSYGVIIRGLYKGRRLEEAVDFCVEMIDAGHSPNVSTFTELVDGFCKEKGVEEARKIVEALKQKGFYMEEKTIKEHLSKKGPRSSMVWQAIFGLKKNAQASC